MWILLGDGCIYQPHSPKDTQVNSIQQKEDNKKTAFCFKIYGGKTMEKLRGKGSQLIAQESPILPAATEN